MKEAYIMYTNKCTKCGAEFQTKNPKRVICPNCLYPDRTAPLLNTEEDNKEDINSSSENKPMSSYSHGGNSYTPRTPQSRSFGNNNRPYNNQRNNNRPYNNDKPFNSDRPYKPYNSQRPNNNRYDRDASRPNQGFRKPRFNNNRPKPEKQLLVTREQLAQIEEIYTKSLPLPNPDIHETIGEKISLEPRKVFFGINLIRQKMKLPKLPFPKRKLAVSLDQLMAIKMLYEPLLPVPPIGCHKLIALQLKMDEWRVHVGIGLIRKQMGLERWNQERADAPEEYRKK